MWKRKTNAKVKELNQPRQNVLFLEFTMETRACLNRDFGSKALERRRSGLQLFSYSYLEVLSVSMFARLLRESVTVACWSPKVTFFDYRLYHKVRYYVEDATYIRSFEIRR